MSKKMLYAIPTLKCNLNCDHCSIKNVPEIFNREKFLEVLNNFDGNIILFGGEVTSNIDRMFDIIESNELGRSKIKSVSTNLISLPDKVLEFYKELGYIATSWNPSRFNSEQYELWKNNCKILSDNDIKYTIMITLTEDLFKIDSKEFLSIAKEWVTPTINQIKFEHYIGDEVTPEYFIRADKWLCDIYNKWNLPVPLEIINRLSCWIHDCDEVYTLYPDGTLVNACPQAKTKCIPQECYTCEKVSKCRPCKLQPYCSYPHELAKLVNKDKEGV